MTPRTLALSVAAVFVSACSGLPVPDLNTSQNRLTVERYVGAFNACDVDQAAALMHADIEWLSLSNSDIQSVSKGKTNLVAESRAYMANGCATRSELSQWSENGPFVSALETVHWTTADGEPRSQSAMSVYEVRDASIRRVWYFPEVKH